MNRLLALGRRLGRRTTATGLIALPFVVTILLFVVAPALGLSSSSTRSASTDTTTTTTGQTTTGETTTGDTTTGSTSGTDETTTTTTDSTSACPTTTDQTTTDQTTTGETTTGQTATDTTPTPTTTSTGDTTTDQATTGETTTDAAAMCLPGAPTADDSPAAKYSVLNGTVNVATDHERLGSSAFPNYANGAVDNYYSLAHSHVDGSPFAEGTASPADSGPIGQTAAAGNAQQPQYADARWPGDSASGNATFGNRGGPYAAAAATDYSATAESELASSSGTGTGNAPSASTAIGAPKGFNGRLRAALAKWKAKWLGRLHLKLPTPARRARKAPAVTIPALPTVTVTPPPVPGVGTVPSPTLPTVTVPSVTVPPVAVPAVPVPVVPAPTVSVPSPPAPQAAASRSLAASSSSSTTTTTTTSTTTTTTATTTTAPTTTTPAPGGPPPDGGSVLQSTSSVELDPKTDALVTSGESSLGLVSLGSGQIVLEGIHVTASITNTGIQPPEDDSTSTTDTSGTTTGDTTTDSTTSTDSTTTGAATTTGTTTAGDDIGSAATYKVSVRVAAASIGGVPVTIDQDGVHVAGQGQALPYQQASDALNGALKQAGIQLSMVGPEIKTNNGEETIDATGVHVYFTQPVSAPGAPAQYAEHILGEVYVDSLAVLGQPLQSFGFGSGPWGSSGQSKPGATSNPGASAKPGAKAKSGKGTKSGKAPKLAGGSPASGSTASGSFPSATGAISSGGDSGSFGGVSEPAASSPTGVAPTSAPASFVSTMKKPVWLLVAFLAWLAISAGTGWSVWKWRREEGA